MWQKIKKKGANWKYLIAFILITICGATFYLLLTRLGLLMPLSELNSVFCLSSCRSNSPLHPQIASERILNFNQSLLQILGNKIEPNKVSILIEKSKYRLTVFHNMKPIKSYPVVFGGNPSGDKLHEGDRKTPEGLFQIRDLYSHPEWSKFIWIDYPTPQSWQKHFQGKIENKINWLLPIGGQIGIHGVPNGQDRLIGQRSNWTWGCISLKNADVNEIYQVVRIGSLVEIVP